MSEGRKFLSEDELMSVSGGNFGDTRAEYDSKTKTFTYMYDVGDIVEVYTSELLHLFTKRARIIERGMADRNTNEMFYCCAYMVRYLDPDDDDGKTHLVYADDIQR